MFDPQYIMDLMKIEPGHGLLQSILLFMIWLSSRNLRDELRGLRVEFSNTKSAIEERFKNLEGRVVTLETGRK